MQSVGPPTSEDTSAPPKPWRSPWSMDDDVQPGSARSAPARITVKRTATPRKSADTPPASPLTNERNATYAKQERRQMNKLLVPSLAVFAFTVLAWVYVRDDEAPWDADLLVEPTAPSVVAPRTPDRLRLALDTSQPATNPELEARMPWQWDTPSLSRMVAANAAASDNLKDLLSDDDWQPQHPAWKAVDLGSHAHWQAFGVARQALAAYHSRKGQDEVAMRACLDLASMAKRLQGISGWPTYYARGVELHERACQSIAELLRETRLDSRSLSQMQAEFDLCSPSDTLLKNGLNGFYEFERRLIIGPQPDDPWDKLAAGLLPERPGRLFFKPNQTLSLFALSFRELKDQAAKPPSAIADQITPRIGRAGQPASFPGGPNSAGMSYANERIWRYASLIDYLSLQRARHALVLTSFGVRRYGLDHGQVPERLEQLVPECFTTLPIDPFTGQAVGYDPVRGVLFSAGIDFKVEGGRTSGEPLSDDNEPTITIR